jgi:hypothetical protein
MSILVLDPSAANQLKSVCELSQLRDEKGTVLGYFHPVATPENCDQYECPLSEEELDRRDREGGGRPLADILRDLERGP